SDFSHCTDCETCVGGYGEGPATEFTAATRRASVRARLPAAHARTHTPPPPPTPFAVIHAHTKKPYFHPDCWYPQPAAPICPCANEVGCATAAPAWVDPMAGHRLRPDWPARLPDDERYGEERQLCLAPELYQGPEA